MRWISLCLAAAVVLGQFATTPTESQTKDKDDKKSPPKITEIGGKTLDQWIAAISSKDRSLSAVAIETVLVFGPEQAKKAVPALLGELRKHKPGVVTVDMSVRINASLALGAIFSSIEDANKGDVDEAVKLMTNFLKDEQRIVKHRVCQALASLGPRASYAIPELIKTTIDFPTWQTRHAAVHALGVVAWKKEGPSRAVLDALYSALTDSASQVRLAAIQALDQLETPDLPKEKFTMDKKVDPLAWKDADKIVRINAHLLVYAVQPQFKGRRLTAIGKLIDDPETPVRVAAVRGIGSIGPEAKEFVPRLKKAVDDDDKVIVVPCIWSLGEIGPAAAPALSSLEAIYKDPKHPLHKPAEDAIEKIKALKKKDAPK